MKLRIMSKKEAVKNIKKRIWIRASQLSLVIAGWLLLDEHAKEGYWFRIQDITLLGSHESLVVIFLAMSGVFAIIHKKTEGGGDELVR